MKYSMKHPASGTKPLFLLILYLVLNSVTGAVGATQQPSFSTRVEPNFGDSPFFFSDGEWRAKRYQQWTNIRSGGRKVAANFLVEDSDVPVSILLSTEARVDTPNKRVFLRLLIDGKPMAPSDVVLVSGDEKERTAAQSFEFTTLADPGLHTVEAQWLVDDGGTGYVRQIGLLVRQGDINLARGSLLGVTADSGKSVETTSRRWQDVPGLSTSVHTAERDCFTATVSAEAYASSGDSGLLRVLINDDVAQPGEVQFVHGRFEGSRSMVFGHCDLASGEQKIRVQWRADGGSAWMGDRTLTVSALPQGISASLRQFFVAADNDVGAPAEFDPMAGMSHSVLVPANSEITALLSVEFPQPPEGEVYARLVVHGQAIADSTTLLADAQTSAGAHTFVFNAKHMHAVDGATFGDIGIEWQSKDGQGSVAAARSLSILAQPQPVPDLATPVPFGGLIENGAVEPMHGERDVLVILWDPARPGHPAPGIGELDNAFNDYSNSVADYYATISNNRISLNVVDVLGPYSADFPASHYWNGPGDHQDKWVEALRKADDDFDFSQFDRDGDGYIQSWHELAVVIVVPQSNSLGVVRHLWSGSGDTPEQFDGVDLELITEWYTSNPQNDYMVAAHELGHHIFMLPDLYGKNPTAIAQLQHGTRPGRLSLMDLSSPGLTAHLDPGLKLALGWVTPTIVKGFSSHVLEDIKTSHEVLVLPRLPGGADAEYLVVENRQDAADNNLYDMNISDSGIAVWHLIEGLADNAPAPPCTSATIWNNQTGVDTHRRGIRLLRPSVTFTNANALWHSEQYDFDPYNLTCPGDGDAHNELRWADGSLSWSILNFGISGESIAFDLQTP